MNKTVEIVDEDKFVSDLVNFACAAHSIIDLDVSEDAAETALIFLAAGVITANVEEIVSEDATAESAEGETSGTVGWVVKHKDGVALYTAKIFPTEDEATQYLDNNMSDYHRHEWVALEVRG